MRSGLTIDGGAEPQATAPSVPDAIIYRDNGRPMSAEPDPADKVTAYCPLNFGFRFSTNAFVPSLASCVWADMVPATAS